MQVCNNHILVDVDDNGKEDDPTDSCFTEWAISLGIRKHYDIVSGIVEAVNGSTGKNSLDGIYLQEGARVWFARNKGLTIKVDGKEMSIVKLKDIIAVDTQ